MHTPTGKKLLTACRDWTFCRASGWAARWRPVCAPASCWTAAGTSSVTYTWTAAAPLLRRRKVRLQSRPLVPNTHTHTITVQATKMLSRKNIELCWESALIIFDFPNYVLEWNKELFFIGAMTKIWLQRGKVNMWIRPSGSGHWSLHSIVMEIH